MRPWVGTFEDLFLLVQVREKKQALLHTNDVAHTICNQIQRCHCRLLRVASHIRRDEREQCHKRTRARLRHVVPDQPTDTVRQRQGDDQDHSHDG